MLKVEIVHFLIRNCLFFGYETMPLKSEEVKHIYYKYYVQGTTLLWRDGVVGHSDKETHPESKSRSKEKLSKDSDVPQMNAFNSKELNETSSNWICVK